MTIPAKPTRAVVSVVEMASMVGLSRSRFHALIQAGIFPRPARNESCKRPVFDQDLQQKCLDIRRTGIGANGQPVLFNRKPKVTARKPHQGREEAAGEHVEMIEALRSLGLTTTAGAVGDALGELFPDGYDDMNQGEVIRQVFLHLQNRK